MPAFSTANVSFRAELLETVKARITELRERQTHIDSKSTFQPLQNQYNLNIYTLNQLAVLTAALEANQELKPFELLDKPEDAAERTIYNNKQAQIQQAVAAGNYTRANTLATSLTGFEKYMLELNTAKINEHREMLQARYLERIAHHLSMILFDDDHELSAKNLAMQFTLGDDNLVKTYMKRKTDAAKQTLFQQMHELTNTTRAQIEQPGSSILAKWHTFAQNKQKAIKYMCVFFGLNDVKTIHESVFKLFERVFVMLQKYKGWFSDARVEPGQQFSKIDTYGLYKVICDAFNKYSTKPIVKEHDAAAFRNFDQYLIAAYDPSTKVRLPIAPAPVEQEEREDAAVEALLQQEQMEVIT